MAYKLAITNKHTKTERRTRRTLLQNLSKHLSLIPLKISIRAFSYDY
nr:MAG TPA: hypothetical protein [Caudoviricetes sp.]